MGTLRKHFVEITSTNDYAKELIVDYDKLIVTADYQLAGKGRNDKKWLGDFGRNVYFTYAINHKFIKPLKNSSYYQIIGCLAVYETLTDLLGSSIKSSIKDFLLRIKYPNDVYINSVDNNKEDKPSYKKLCGVLSEHSYMGGDLNTTVLGIGININQKTFDNTLNNNATSLINLGYSIDLEEVINLLTIKLEKLLSLREDINFNNWLNLTNLTNKEFQVFNKVGVFRLNKILEDCRLELINTDPNSSINNKIIIDNGDSIRYELL